MFVSTRRFGHTVCQPGPASNLYRVPAQGGTAAVPEHEHAVRHDAATAARRPRAVHALGIRGPGFDLPPEPVDAEPRRHRLSAVLRQHPPRPGHVLAGAARCPARATGCWPPLRRITAIRTVRSAGSTEATVRKRRGAWASNGSPSEFPTIGDTPTPGPIATRFRWTRSRFLCSYGGGSQRFRMFLHDVQDRRRLLYEDAGDALLLSRSRCGRRRSAAAASPWRHRRVAGDVPEDEPAGRAAHGHLPAGGRLPGAGPAIAARRE